MTKHHWSRSNLNKARVLYDMLRTGFYFKYSEEMLNDVARIVGNSIYDIGPFFTGYISETAIARKLNDKGYAPVDEHFMSRQQSGKLIILSMMQYKDMSFDQFLGVLEPHCCTHKTTKEENIQLIPFQQRGLKWDDCYKHAGIKLVHVGTDHRLTRKYLQAFVKSS